MKKKKRTPPGPPGRTNGASACSAKSAGTSSWRAGTSIIAEYGGRLLVWSTSTPLHFCFQAEDGIRDLYVTRVQTCALPIFTSYTVERLAEQLGGWVAEGIPRVKM